MGSKSRYLTATEIANLVRGELKGAFPAVKFSVRKDRSGSLRVEWTDGPTKKRVEEILAKYDGKGFDGSIDLAYYIEGWVKDGKLVGTRCTGTVGSMGYVQPWGLEPPVEGAELVGLMSGYHNAIRNISPKFANRVIAQLAAYWGGVTEIPVAVPTLPSRWDPKPTGHTLTPAGIGNRPPRPDLGGNGTGRFYDWSDLIHQAAEDATRYSEARRALVVEEAPEILVEDPPAPTSAWHPAPVAPDGTVRPVPALKNDPPTIALSALLAASLAGPAAERQLAELVSQADGILTPEQVRASLRVIRSGVQ